MNRFTLSLAVPFVALLGWVASIETGLKMGTTIRLKVQGYDPRDLLSGHYLQYALDTGTIHACTSYLNYDEACLCFTPSSDNNTYKASWGGVCDNKPADCSIFIKGACIYGQFESGANRYYVPESYARYVRTAPPNSSIEVTLSSNGTVLVKNFYVGDETLDQYVAHKSP